MKQLLALKSILLFFLSITLLSVFGQELPYSSSWSITNSNIQTCNTLRGQQDDYFYMGGKFSGSIDTNAVGVVSPDRFNNSIVLATSLTSEAYALKVQKSSGKVDSSIQFAPSGNSETIQSSEIISIGTSAQFQVFAGIINSNQGIFISKFNTNGMEWTQTYLFSSGNYITVRDSKVVDTSIVILGTYRGSISISNASIALTSASSQDYENMFLAILDMSGAIQYIYTNNGNSAKVIPQNLHLSSSGDFCYVMGIFSGSTLSFTKSASSSEQLTLTSSTSTDQYDLFHLKYSITNRELVWLIGTTGPDQADYSYKIVGSSPSTIFAFREIIIDQGYSESSDCGSRTDLPIATLTRDLFTLLSSNLLFGSASASSSQNLNFFKALNFAGFSNSILFDNGTTSSIMNISRSTPLTVSSTGFSTCPNRQALMNYTTEYTLNYNTASSFETILLKSFLTVPKLLFTSNYNVGVVNYAGITSTLTFNLPSNVLALIDKNLVVDVGGTKRPVKNSNSAYTADLFSTSIGWNNISIYFNNTAQNRYDLISMNSVKTFFFDDSLVISIQNSTILFNSSTLTNSRSSLILSGLLNSTYSFPQDYLSSIMCRVGQQYFATNIDGSQITCQNVPFSERNTTVLLVYRYSNSLYFNISRTLDLSFIETRTLSTPSTYRTITTDEQSKGSLVLSLTVGKTLGSLDVKLQATNQNGAVSLLPFTLSGTSISATLTVAQFEKADLKLVVKSQSNDYVDFSNLVSIQFLKQLKFTSLSSTIDSTRQMKTIFSVQPNLIDSLKTQIICQYNESPTLRTALNTSDNSCNIDNRFLSTNNTLQLILNMGGTFIQISDTVSLTSPLLPTISLQFTPNFGINGFANISTEITSQDLIFEQLKRNLQIEINSIRYTPTVALDGKVILPLISTSNGWNNLTVLGKYSSNDTSYSVISNQNKIYIFNTPQTNTFTFPNGNISLITPASSRNFMIDLALSSTFEIPYSLLNPNTFFCNIFGEVYSAQFLSTTRVQCQNVVSREGETDLYITTSIRNTTFEVSTRSLFTFVKTREIKPVGVSPIQSTDIYVATLTQSQSSYSVRIGIEDSLFNSLPIENTQKLSIQLTDLLNNQKQSKFPQITRGLNMSTLSLNLDVGTSQAIFKYEIRVFFKGVEISILPLKYLLVRESPIGKVVSSRDSSDNLLVSMPRVLSTTPTIGDEEKLIMDRMYCLFGESTTSKVSYSTTIGIQCKIPTDFTSTQTKTVQLFMSFNDVATNSSLIKISSNSQLAYPIYCYNIPHYLPTVCSSMGSCKQTDNCTCTNNFQGNDCSFTQCFGIASTDKSVCSGYGQCPTSNNCVCSLGFSGTRCENKVMYLSEDKSWLSTSESISTLPRSQLDAMIQSESLNKIDCPSLFSTVSVDLIGSDAFCFMNTADIVVVLSRSILNTSVLLPSSTIGTVLTKTYSQYQVLDTKGKSTSPQILLRTSFSNVNFPAVIEPLIVSASPLSNLDLSWQSDDPNISTQLSSFNNLSIIKLNLGTKTRQSGSPSTGAVNLVLQVVDSTFNTLTKYSTQLLLNRSSNTGEAIFNYGGDSIECQSFASCDVAFSVAPIKGSAILSSLYPSNGNVTTKYIHNLKNVAEGCSTVYSLRSTESKRVCIKIRDRGVIQYYLDVNTRQDNSISVVLSRYNTSSKVYATAMPSGSETLECIHLNSNASVQGVKDVSSSIISFKGIKEQEPYEIRFTSSLGKTSVKVQYSASMQLKLLTFIPKIMGRRSSLILSSLVDSDSPIQQVAFLLTKKGQSQATNLPIIQQTSDFTISQALLDGSLLESGSFYVLRVQSKNSKGQLSYIEQTFYVQLEPKYNIQCSVTPKEGIAFETEFTVSCLSSNLDLDSYQFLITNATHKLELSKGRKRAFFTRIGFLQNSKLQVRTNDVWNSEKITEIPIQIKHPKQVYTTSSEFYQYLTRKIQDLLNEDTSPNTLGYDYVNSVTTFMSMISADSAIVSNYSYRNELGVSLLDIIEKIIGYAYQNKDSSYMGRILPVMNQFLQIFSNATLNNRDRVYGLVNSTLDILQDFNPNYSVNEVFSIVDRVIPLVSKGLQTQLFNKLRMVNQQNLFDAMKNGYLLSNFSKLSNLTLVNYQVINMNIVGRKISDTINFNSISLNLPSEVSSDSSNSLFEVSALIYQTNLKTNRREMQTTISTPINVQVAVKKNSIPLTTDSLFANVTFPIQLGNKTRAQCRSFSLQEEPRNHTTLQFDSSVVCVVPFSDLSSRNLYVDTYEGPLFGTLSSISSSNALKTPILADNTLTIALATILSTIGLICICCSVLVLLYMVGKCRKKNDRPTMTEYTYKASGSLSPIGISDHSSGSDKNSETSSERNQHTTVATASNQRVTDISSVELLNGQYQLLEVVSMHSNYTIYRANNVSTDQVVCIKKIAFSSFEEINSPSSVIVKEYTNMSRTQHTNIVKMYEVFVDTSIKAVCLALEYFELGNLNQLMLKKIQQKQVFDERHIGQILYQLSQALSYLHDECELCHRNIRLENIYVRQYSPQKIDVCLGEFTDSRSRNSLKIELDIQDQSFGSAISSYKFGNFTKAVKENAIKSTSDQFTSDDVFQLGCVMYRIMSLDTESDVNLLFEEYEFEKDVFTLLESKIHSSYSREIVSIVFSMFAREERKRPNMNQVTNLLGNVFKFETQ